MSNLVPIKALFDFEKGQLQSSKNTAGEYTFITASAEWKTHETYTHDCEALIFAMAASGSLGRTHYFNGKFISSDLCFILTPKEKYKDQIDLKFYHTIFNDLRESIVKQTATGTSKISINRANFGNFEIPFFDKEHQETVRKKLGIIHPIQQEFSAELQTQSALISKLRSSILSDAVSGRLVLQDPTDEPASVLLKRIKAEKERLIKEGELKLDKPLFPISADEIPYELPVGWMWGRLGDIANLVEFGTSCKANEVGDVPVISMGHIQNGKILSRNFKFLRSDNSDLPKLFLQQNDLVFNRTNSYELVGKTALFEGENNKYTFASYLIRVRLSSCVNAKFYNFCMGSSYFRETQIEPQIVKQCGQANYNGTKLKNTLIPIPPFVEQHRIVTKIEQLMTTCDAIEAEVAKSRAKADRLMQTILKEAFD
jgi:type I restriction enzyme S subunit